MVRAHGATRRIGTLLTVALVTTSVWAIDSGNASAAAPSASKKKPAPITILVTNDDGVGAPGIDTLANGLRTAPKTKVVVVAPATNQTGAGGRVTAGPLTGGAATTASGYPATAVQGTPADSVNYALDTVGVKPNVTISGVNLGQNLGPVVDASGTVGAARESVKRGVPALAVSAQIGDATDYPTATEVVLEWLAKNRAALTKKPKGKAPSPPTTVTNLNVPTCPGGQLRGTLETVSAPPGTPDAIKTTINCASTGTSYANDVAAFNDGWATFTQVPLL